MDYYNDMFRLLMDYYNEIFRLTMDYYNDDVDVKALWWRVVNSRLIIHVKL